MSSNTAPTTITNRKTSKIDDSGDDSAESSSSAENLTKPNTIEGNAHAINSSDSVLSKPIADLVSETTFKEAASSSQVCVAHNFKPIDQFLIDIND